MKIQNLTSILFLTLLAVPYQNCAPSSGFQTISSTVASNSQTNSNGSSSGEVTSPGPAPAPGAQPMPMPAPLPQPQVPAPGPQPMPMPQPPAPQPMPPPAPLDVTSSYVTKNWPTLRERLKKVTAIYDMQIVIQPFVEWIAEFDRRDLAREVLDVYALRLADLTTENDLMAYGGATGTGSGYSSAPVLQSYQAWMGSGTPRVESLLNSTQFLFGVSRMVLELDPSDPRMTQWAPVMKSHYLRWTRGIEADPTKGPWQVRGWGCGGNRYNHFEFIKRLLAKSFGTATSVSYCNAVTDVEMWVIAGSALLLKLNEQNPSMKLLSADESAFLKSYLTVGFQLMSSRLTATQVSVEGVLEKAVHFDAGFWRDHPGGNYAGYTGSAFPTQVGIAPIKGPATLNFDTSHMRRIVPVLNVLVETKALIGSTFPSAENAKQVSLQLSYGIFNGDFSKPLFTNYADGTNGWYRIDYNGPGTGYHPFAMTSSYLTGGYCQFANYEPRIRKLCSSILSRVQGSAAQDLAYKQQLRECYTSNYQKSNCDNMSIEQVNFSVLSFLSSLR